MHQKWVFQHFPLPKCEVKEQISAQIFDAVQSHSLQFEQSSGKTFLQRFRYLKVSGAEVF
jgi:hypothetical protein